MTLVTRVTRVNWTARVTWVTEVTKDDLAKTVTWVTSHPSHPKSS